MYARKSSGLRMGNGVLILTSYVVLDSPFVSASPEAFI